MRRDVDQSGRTQPVQVPMPEVSGTSVVVVQIADGNHTEGTDGRERAHLGAPQLVVVVMDMHPLAFQPTRQVESLREHVPGIYGGVVARVGITLPTVERTGVQLVPHTVTVSTTTL